MTCNWIKKNHDQEKENLLIQNGVSKFVARLMSQRLPHKAQDIFVSDYKKLNNPLSLNGIDLASDIFLEVAEKKGKIAVIGDYDCDGIISSVMLKEACIAFKLNCDVFLPSRLDHGYGLNQKTVQAFIEKHKELPDLLIVTDCGINNRNEIDMLFEHGIKKIIIIDHHTVDNKLISKNASALINWHLNDNFNEMCACGEVFHFIRALNNKCNNINPIEFLTYAAIGTIADVSPIFGDNRIIVKNGLTSFAINHVVGAGLHAILNECKIHKSFLTQEDVSFKLAPKINAVGRMYKPDLMAECFLERDLTKSTKMVKYIDKFNTERKKEQEQIINEAKKIIEKNEKQFDHGILLFKKTWHIGVLGIAAAKLTELYNKPCVIIGFQNGEWKGSGRSPNNINIKNILDNCCDLFDSYGGHAGAVGVTLKQSMTEEASNIFNQTCSAFLDKSGVQLKSNYYDADLLPKAISPDVAEQLFELYPYCKQYNEEPIFQIRSAHITEVEYIEKPTWRLLKFSVIKDNYKIPYKFKTFNPKSGSEIEGRLVNVLFKFPQKIKDPMNRFFVFDLNVIDVIFL